MTAPAPEKAAPIPVEVLAKLVDLVEELCEAVDCESDDIGGKRGSLTILREIGPLVKPARAILADQPARPVPGDLEEAVRLAEVGEYLYSARAYSYGNGYTEPREYGIAWEWQQSKPDEYGQGVLLAEATKWHAEQAADGAVTEAAKLRATLADRASQEERIREDLERLEKAATEVSRLGAVTGPQWSRLSVALGRARARQRGDAS